MSETTAQVYTAISEVSAELAQVGIAKGRKNQQQGYAFRGIDDVYGTLAPLLAKHRLVIVPRYLTRQVAEHPSRNGGVLFYVTLEAEFDIISAVDGSKHTAKAFGEAMDSGDKATGKAMSAAYKTMAFQLFCIPTEGDNDTENGSPEVKQRNGAAGMSEDEKFVALLNDAFDARDFKPDDRKATVAAVCKSKRVQRVTALKPDDLTKFLEAIAAGKMDQYKKQAETAAA